MKSSNKYSLKESDFVLSVLNCVSYKYRCYNESTAIQEDIVLRKVRRQLRSKNGRSDACKFLLNRLYRLSAKDRFHLFVTYEENGKTHCNTFSEVESKLRGLIEK